MYKIAICDDHKVTVDHISEFIKKRFREQCRVSEFTTSRELEYHINIILKGELDILIIDIDLVIDNGIKVAERLKSSYPDIRVIFISGQIGFVGGIFEIIPIYFVEKPMDDTKLLSAINLAIQDIEESTRDATIVIESKGTVISLNFKGIKYFENNKRTIIVHEGKNRRIVYSKLDLIEKSMPLGFCRCHQSYIVNFDYVRELKMYQFDLSDGAIVPISQLKYKEVKRLFLKYLGGSL